ncbi:MAG: acyloxyacyl hydrolase [Woeseiaceae bacterium]|nr:acyloxyacyl hydrolase [Woeseiaceae bacterium]
MNSPRQYRPTIIRSRLLHAVLFTVAMTSFALHGLNAYGATALPSGYRVVSAYHKFDGTSQFAALFRLRPPRRLRSEHLELAIGAIASSADTRAFVSLGPVWRWPIGEGSWHAELGFSPTLIGGSAFGDRDLGGVLHFTSSASVGATFGRRQSASLSLRIQHTSNGGLDSTNPGLDMIGLDFAWIPRKQ